MLKKGVDIMWSAKVAHEMSDVWGTDALDFNPERFLGEVGKDTEKKRRAAYMPFGGGAHLCPGRNFAFAEILGLISALVLGYEIVGLQAEKIKMGPRVLASAIPKPTEDGDGGPVTLKRREGWEDVEWSFAC